MSLQRFVFFADKVRVESNSRFHITLAVVAYALKTAPVPERSASVRLMNRIVSDALYWDCDLATERLHEAWKDVRTSGVRDSFFVIEIHCLSRMDNRRDRRIEMV